MEIEVLDAVNGVILAPAIGGAIRAAREQTMQHGEKRGALQR